VVVSTTGVSSARITGWLGQAFYDVLGLSAPARAVPVSPVPLPKPQS
jgi:hypothetical protein